jgi:hypothetical protein
VGHILHFSLSTLRQETVLQLPVYCCV